MCRQLDLFGRKPLAVRWHADQGREQQGSQPHAASLSEFIKLADAKSNPMLIHIAGDCE
jgi:hypothetical protein